jgi:hypothetical protein
MRAQLFSPPSTHTVHTHLVEVRGHGDEGGKPSERVPCGVVVQALLPADDAWLVMVLVGWLVMVLVGWCRLWRRAGCGVVQVVQVKGAQRRDTGLAVVPGKGLRCTPDTTQTNTHHRHTCDQEDGEPH